MSATPPRRGRPPAATSPKPAAERKRDQRQRDQRLVLTSGASLDEATLTALVESIPRLLADDYPASLGEVLKELGRRGGLTVTWRTSGRKGSRIS